jgi:hypothetical protein
MGALVTVLRLKKPTSTSTSTLGKAEETTTIQSTELSTDSHTNELESEAVTEAADKYLSAITALVVMNPSEKKSLMRFTAVMSQENLTSKADTLIDTAISLNFVSKKFLNANGFYKYYKAAPKIAVRVANEQRISTDKIFCRSVFTIDGHNFSGLEFRVLPHFKSSDIILGLPALRDLDVTIHPSSNEFTVKNATVVCHREPIRISCILVDTSKMDKILVKQSRNKKNPSYVFMISLQFKEDLDTIKSDFGEEFDKQIKKLITEFADVTEEPEGLPPQRGMSDHKVKLTGYPPKQRRNRLTVHEYDEFKR